MFLLNHFLRPHKNSSKWDNKLYEWTDLLISRPPSPLKRKIEASFIRQKEEWNRHKLRERWMGADPFPFGLQPNPKNENLLNGVLAVAANKSGFSSQKIYVWLLYREASSLTSHDSCGKSSSILLAFYIDVTFSPLCNLNQYIVTLVLMALWPPLCIANLLCFASKLF